MLGFGKPNKNSELKKAAKEKASKLCRYLNDIGEGEQWEAKIFDNNLEEVGYVTVYVYATNDAKNTRLGDIYHAVEHLKMQYDHTTYNASTERPAVVIKVTEA